MNKKQCFKTLIVLLVLNSIWAFSWAILHDFYPGHKAFETVLSTKAWVNLFATSIFLLVAAEKRWWEKE